MLAVDLVAPIENQTWSSLGGESLVIPIQQTFAVDDVRGTVVRFATNVPQSNNDFFVELYDAEGTAGVLTPGTVENFLQYVGDGSYDNTMIHRSVPDIVVQGGGFTAPSVAADQPGSDPVAIPTKGTITNEPGNSNRRGTFAMAKLGGQPNSATSQWFINLSDNLSLDTDNGGYAVFGEVLGDGMTVVDVLGSALTYDATTYYSNGAFSDLPLWNVNADNVVLPQDFVKIEGIQAADPHELMTYQVETSNESLLSGGVDDDGNLVLTPASGHVGDVTVTVTARSVTDGSTNATSFTVYLGDAFGSGFWLDTIRDTLPEDVSTAEPIRLAEVSFIEAAAIDGLSLGGPDAELFEFGERVTDFGSEYVVQLRSGVQLDFETRPFLQCVVSGYGREQSVTLRLTDVNDRPTLNDWNSPRLTTIEPNLGSPVPGSVYGSTLVRDLLNTYPLGNYADPDGDAGGIAITAVNMQGGMVWFTTDNGVTWQEVGGVEERSAVVLYADHATRLYFEPAPGFSGQLGDVITLKAWDRSGRHQNGDREVDTLPELGWEPIESRVDTGALVEQVAVSPDGKTVFAVNGNSLVVIDISNPAAPQTVATWTANHPVLDVELQNVDVAVSPDGRYVAVAHERDGMISVLDVLNQANLQLVARFENAGPVGHVSFSADGSYVYATRGQDAFHDGAFLSFRFLNGLGQIRPAATAAVTFAEGNPAPTEIAVSPDGQLVAFGSEANEGGADGVFVLDVSDPSLPTLLSRTSVGSGLVYDVLFASDSRTLYVAEATAIHRLKLDDPAAPVFAGWNHSAWDLACRGLAITAGDEQLFVARSSGGTSAYDVSSGQPIDGVGYFATSVPGDDVAAVDVAVARSRYVIVAESTAIMVYENAYASAVLDVLPMNSPGGKVLSDGDGLVYVSDSWGGLTIANVESPSEISKLERFVLPQQGASHEAISGPLGRLVIADGDAGVSFVRTDSSGHLTFEQSVALNGRIIDVAFQVDEVVYSDDFVFGGRVDSQPLTGSGTVFAVAEDLGIYLIPVTWDRVSYLVGAPQFLAISGVDWVFKAPFYAVSNFSRGQAFLYDDTNWFVASAVGRQEYEVWAELSEGWQHLATMNASGWAHQVTFDSDRKIGFISAGWSGVDIVDFSDRASPRLIKNVSVPGHNIQSALSQDGRWLYVAGGEQGVTVIDIAVPENARVDRRIDTLGTAGSVTLSADGQVLYVGDWDEGLIALDVGDQARFSANVDTVAVTVLPPVAQPVVSMPNVEVDPSEGFTVPVEITNVGDLLSVSFTVTYDPAVVEVTGVRRGEVIAGWLFQPNTETAGEIRVSAASLEAALSTGTLFEIDFLAVGARGAGTVLDITRADFNGGGIVADARNGSIQVRQGGSVSGRVTYYSDPTLGVPSVEIGYFPWEGPFAPAVMLAVQTDWSGYYRVEDTGYLRVTPWGRADSFGGGYPESGISAWDASLVLRYDAGLIPLSDYQLIAGDVNRSGAVNAFDAALIMRKVVGLNLGSHGWSRDWAFVPPVREYDNLQTDLADQDFAAILVGDVSGDWRPRVYSIGGSPLAEPIRVSTGMNDSPSWAPSSLRSFDHILGETSVVLAAAPALPGARANVAVRLDGGSGDVYSLEAVIAFDPTQLRLTKSDLEGAATNAMVFLNEIEPGRAKLVMASTEPLSRGEVLVGFRPRLIGAAESGLLRLERVELNEGGITARPVSANVERLHIVEAAGHVSLGKDRDGRHYADNTPMKYRGSDVAGNVLGTWAVFGADVVRGRNVAHVARAETETPTHVWRMAAGWDFGGIEGLGNAGSVMLSRGTGRQPDGDGTDSSAGDASREFIEENGLISLTRDGNGLLYANNTTIIFAGGALVMPFGGEFEPVAAEVVDGRNEVLFHSNRGETRRTIHDQNWAFIGADERQSERLFVTLAADSRSAQLERDRILAEAERDFDVELNGDGVLGPTLLSRGDGSLP